MPAKKIEAFESHIRLPADDHAALRKTAAKDARSVTGQIIYYVRRGLEQDRVKSQGK